MVIEDLNTLNQYNLIDMYKPLHPTTGEHTLFFYKCTWNIYQNLPYSGLKEIKSISKTLSIKKSQAQMSLLLNSAIYLKRNSINLILTPLENEKGLNISQFIL